MAMTIREKLLAASYGLIDRAGETCSKLVLLISENLQRVHRSVFRAGREAAHPATPESNDTFVGSEIDSISRTIDDLVCRLKGGVQHTDLTLREAGGQFQNEAQAAPEAVDQELKEATKKFAISAWQLGLSLFSAHTSTVKASGQSHWSTMKDGKIPLKDALYGGFSNFCSLFNMQDVFGFKLEDASLYKPLSHVVGAALFAAFAITVIKSWKSARKAAGHFGASMTRLRRAVLAKLGFYVVEPKLPVPEVTRSWATGTFDSNISYTWAYSRR